MTVDSPPDGDARYSFAEAFPQIVWVTSPEGRHIYFNRRWYEYTGVSREASLGDGWTSLLHPDDRDQSMKLWRAATQQGRSYEAEYRFRNAEGSYRWFLGRALPQRDDRGAVTQWIGTCTDIDDQRRQSELLERLVWEQTSELRRSNFDLEQFAAVASHDLQEPLRKIQAFSDRLQVKCGPELGDQGKEYLERIVNAVARMRSLINDLLTFSRVTLKGRPFAKVDLQEVGREVVSDLEVAIQQGGGRVELGPMPTIQADPLQMRQLFQNLIGNGLKFHRPDAPPVVRVSAFEVFNKGEAQPIAYELRFADEGIGFEEIYLERIFQVFQRLHGRNEYDGTGMGLAICRKIVERHSGKITATSEPGKGSTFTITLPVHPVNQEFSLHDTRTQADHDPDG
jgi:PAS domain S-box-containing protein